MKLKSKKPPRPSKSSGYRQPPSEFEIKMHILLAKKLIGKNHVNKKGVAPAFKLLRNFINRERVNKDGANIARLAKVLGVSWTTMQRIHDGETKPTLDQAFLLEDIEPSIPAHAWKGYLP